MRELVESLSESTRQTLHMILYYHNDDLRTSFTKRTYKSQVAKKTGTSRASVERFVQELRQRIPEHLSTVEV